MKRNLTKQEILRVKDDINRVFSSGNSCSCKGLKLIHLETENDYSRVLFSPSRQYKNAIERNYQKRISKEIYRNIKSRIKKGYDFVFILYPGEYVYSDRLEQFEHLLKRLKMLS